VTKLVFVNRYFYPDHSATSQMLSDLAFSLAETTDYQIHIITSRQRYDDARAALAASETIRDVQIHRVWTSRFGRQNLLGRAFDYLSFYFTAFFALMALADKQSVIVAKTDPPLISVIAALAAKIKSARLVNWIQDLFPEVAAALGVRLAQGPQYSVLKWLRNRSLNSARVNVVIGELMKQKLIDEGIPPEQIQVINNWADDQIKPVPPEENSLRKEWGMDGKFVVGYSGNLGRSHDFNTILDAASELKEKTHIVFLFIGGGANLSWVESEVNKRGLPNVIFKPYQPRERLAQSLSAADVHLVSLRPELEGLIVPSKFYGILAAGRPVIFIGAKFGELSRIIASADCGITVEQNDASSLVQQIQSLEEAPDKCATQGKRAWQILEMEYGHNKALQSWVDIVGLLRTDSGSKHNTSQITAV